MYLIFFSEILSPIYNIRTHEKYIKKINSPPFEKVKGLKTVTDTKIMKPKIDVDINKEKKKS